MTFSYDEMNLYVVTQDDKKASIGSFFLSFFLFSPVLFLPARFIDCLSSHAPLLTGAFYTPWEQGRGGRL